MEFIYVKFSFSNNLLLNYCPHGGAMSEKLPVNKHVSLRIRKHVHGTPGGGETRENV